MLFRSHIGSSGVTTRTVKESAPLENSLGFFPSVGKAVSLAEQMNVVPTIQTIKTLEQRLTDFDAQVRPRIDTFMDKEYNSDFNIDMSQTNCPQTTDFEDWRSELHDCSLDLCSLMIEDGDPQTVRAPTLEYVAPSPYVPPKGLEIHLVKEIEAMWAKWDKNSRLNPSKRISSNKDI